MNFYTYMWLRENGIPYYVGKGTGQRAFRKGCPPHERIILQDWPSESDAFQAEIALIKFYGRKDLGTGCLNNQTDGGEGLSGHKFSEDHKLKIGRAHKGKIVVLSTRQKLSVARKGMHLSEDWRRKIGESGKGKKNSELQKRTTAENNKKRVWTVEARAAIAAANKRRSICQST